ncbi:MAG: cyclic pyranopterin monophosphate synthase MoaC [Polyangiaceae bacterium]|nr:cyclic pyranopterin monophosphate synthase MoaC [Polyangiaceae bacterium]
MTVFAFERIADDLPLLPLAARRALDAAGCKLSLAGWRTLCVADRVALTAAGARELVDRDAARTVAGRAVPPPGAMPPAADERVPAELPGSVAAALGPARPLDAATWADLTALARFALRHLAAERRRERIGAAYDELVRDGAGRASAATAPAGVAVPRLTHLSARGEAHMVDVSDKRVTERRAVAEARVRMQPATARLIADDRAKKGDVLAAARIAGIMAAKRTPELIPLCHGIALSRVVVELAVDAERGLVTVRAEATAVDRTGVEMEAMVAASVASLVLYDMLKSADRGMTIERVALAEKSGGRSGHWRREPEALATEGPSTPEEIPR